MKHKQIKIYSDDIQKTIDRLERAIDQNCLSMYNGWKNALEEAYLEGVIEYESALMQYNSAIDEANSHLYMELEHIYKTYEPVKVIDLADVYFCTTKQ